MDGEWEMKCFTRWGAAFALAVVLTPMSGRAQQVDPTAATSSIPVRKSWTSDRHELTEGDLITVLIDEFIMASANKNQSASQEKNRDLGITAALPGKSVGGGLQTQNDVGDRQKGESSRQQRFSGEISARVVEVSPSGLVRVQGTKKLQIDDVEEEVTIRGWIRPQDVSLSNTVESWRLSDAEILYASNGTLGETGGFWTRWLNKIWP
jgi:flagellar L-ring protein precursor FlgH